MDIFYFLNSTITAYQNLDQKLGYLGKLLILGEAVAARSSPNRAYIALEILLFHVTCKS
jgi:hypothetical protein